MTKSTQMTRACRGSWVRSRGQSGGQRAPKNALFKKRRGVGTTEEDTAAEEPETGAAATREEAETAVQVAAAHLGEADNAAAEKERYFPLCFFPP